MNIGFIDLGIMGQPMALNLMREDETLYVCARRPQTVEPLLKRGAIGCGSPKSLAQHCEVIFLMVSDITDLQEVTLGDQGLQQGAQPGSGSVDMSTIAADASRAMAAPLQDKGVHMLDAPVSGGEQGAINATLSIMVGGDDAVFERIHPLI